MKSLIKAAVIFIGLSLLAGCGGSFEWFPEADTASSTSTTTATSTTAPVANAGAAQSVFTGTVVSLDGSGSTAASGATLTYSWVITTKPSLSVAVLSSATAAKPTFTPDVAGAYVLSLVVSDGKTSSSASAVIITATANSTPVAKAGADQSVTTGSVVILDGSASSDAEGSPLTYLWAITSVPPGSTATLSNAIAVKPTFTADVAGAYVFSLIVKDGIVSSAADTVSITATDTGSLLVTW